MSELLTEAEVLTGIEGTDWKPEGAAIVLDRKLGDFDSAWAFASAVAQAAREADHHPDILVHGWNGVRVTLSTHSAGGVTDLDLSLARTIGALPN